MITSGRRIASVIATNWTVAFHLPSIDVSNRRPPDSTAARRPRIVNSRPTMTSATHGDARCTDTSAISAEVTSSLSAVVSRNAPSRVVTPQRRASRPSNQSVAAATTNTTAAASYEPTEHERHHHRAEQNPQPGASGEHPG